MFYIYSIKLVDEKVVALANNISWKSLGSFMCQLTGRTFCQAFLLTSTPAGVNQLIIFVRNFAKLQIKKPPSI